MEPQRRSIVAPDGRTRTWLLLVAGATVAEAGQRVPLLVALHGGGESARRFHAGSGFSQLAERHGFVLVYPDGVGDHDELDPRRIRRRSWNAGRCCGPARREGVDDVGFVTALVEQLGRELPVDAGRRYAVGHSNGGMLALRLALERPGLFRGIGVQSASIAVDSAGPEVATHLIAVHGLADRHHPIDGGRGPDSAVESPYGSVREACARFASVPGAEVELVEVPGGTHSWMGPLAAGMAAEGLRAGRRVAGGPPFAGYDTATAMWDFLSGAGSAPK